MSALFFLALFACSDKKISDTSAVENLDSGDEEQADPNADSDADGLSDYDETNTHNTDPNNSDTDNDGLSDFDEVNTHNTDPNSSDTDSDGLSDFDEVNTHGTDPNSSDTDDDGLNDFDETNTHGTDPNSTDSDNDGLSDFDEVNTHGTDPNDGDTDDDGLNDFDEINTHNTNPNNSDTDNDGLSDFDEVNTHGTDPNSSDTDNDGLNDFNEANTHGTDPNDGDTDDDGLNDFDEVNTHSTDPNNSDTDNDGLSDFDEVNTHSTDPNLSDTDNDGLSDFDEVNIHSTDPNLSDTDNDGLSDFEETNTHGTEPNNSDTDNDGLSDFDEVNTHSTDPNLSDTDNDGLSDFDEVNIHSTDPNLSDTDNDGLSDFDEVNTHSSNPNSTDTDNDGLNDFDEVNTHGTNPNSNDTDNDGLNDFDEINTHDTDPNDSDTDNDGLSDFDETNTHNSNPNSTDTDNDGLNDFDEVNTHGTNPNSSDTDNDGLSDFEEVNTHSTDPNLSDTDNDGLSDFEEVNTHGTNPNSADTDNDGLSDFDEVNTHSTDPNLSDTDSDNVDDGLEVQTYNTDPNIVNLGCDEIPLACPTSQYYEGVSGSFTQDTASVQFVVDPFNSSNRCAELYLNFDTDTNGFRITFDGSVIQSTSPTFCENDCVGVENGALADLTANGVCEDGGNNSTSYSCILGFDCSDCGPRSNVLVAFANTPSDLTLPTNVFATYTADENVTPLQASTYHPYVNMYIDRSNGSYLVPIQFPRGGQSGDVFEPGCYGFRLATDAPLSSVQYTLDVNRSDNERMNINVIKAPGANFSDDQVIDTIGFSRMYWATAGIEIGNINIETMSSQWDIVSLADDDGNGAIDYLDMLIDSSALRQNDAVNIYLVHDIASFTGFGYNPLGTPAPNSSMNGILLSVSAGDENGDQVYQINELQSLAQTLVHEVGHALGLNHPSEKDASLHDPLADTQNCTLSNDTNGSGELAPDECIMQSDNIMFWSKLNIHNQNIFRLVDQSFSAQQGNIVRSLYTHSASTFTCSTHTDCLGYELCKNNLCEVAYGRSFEISAVNAIISPSVTDPTDAPDPYYEVSYGAQYEGTTPLYDENGNTTYGYNQSSNVASNTSAPSWSDTHYFVSTQSMGSEITISLWDFDSNGDEFIETFDIDPSSIQLLQSTTQSKSNNGTNLIFNIAH